MLESGANYTLCSCSHLTSFLATIAPPISPPRFDLITWANLFKYPAGIFMLFGYTAVFVILALSASKADGELDVIGIRQVYQVLSQEVNDGLHYDAQLDPNADALEQDRTDVHDPATFKEWVQWLWKAFVVHKLFSIWKRHPCDETASVDRVWIIYCCFLCGAAIGNHRFDLGNLYRLSVSRSCLCR